MPLIIKRKLIDKSSPTICVPIVEENFDDIIFAANILASKKVDMVEWRADFYNNLFDKEERDKLLNALKGIFSNIIFLVTVRTVKEGGNIDLEQNEMEELLLEIARTRCPDLIDVEYFTYANPTPMIAMIQSDGCNVIASHHDFDTTPSRQVCKRLLEEMGKADPDIIKLCCMPKNAKDVFELGIASTDYSESNPNMPMIIVSMGKEGAMTRVIPGAFASCVSFATVDKSSAPGQIEYDMVREIFSLTGDII